MSAPSEAELLELLVEDARAKSASERIPDDWEETLAKVRAEHVERRSAGPRGPRGSDKLARSPYKVPGFESRRLLDQLRFDGLDGSSL